MANEKRIPVREQDGKIRATNYEEVSYGYNAEEATEEAKRCLNCKNPRCVAACPVNINIPAFIAEVKNGDVKKAYEIISSSSALPAVCGRVCPQETQCEGSCVRGIKGDAVCIGKLERFVADTARENNYQTAKPQKYNGKNVAIIGSGPSGLSCAGDLISLGYGVTVFEALHELGGVLVYGIPEFRLPKEKVELFAEGYDAVYIGSGAGLPRFMGIAGETANGVFSANEILTRNNLMKAYDENYDTPIKLGKKVVVVGGGNVAMDAARTAIRSGAETHVVYRRSESELPARKEEVGHAKEEGVVFDLLTNPTEILVGDDGSVKGVRLIKMQLGEPDASGRRSPVEISGSEYDVECDSVIMALGTSPNPLISMTTDGLETDKRKRIIADENGVTTKKGVFAGGDAVTGAATVILAMQAGKKAAASIAEYISTEK